MSTQYTLLERLRVNSAPLIGLLQTQPHPVLTEAAAMCGFDFVLIDGEHGFFADADHVALLQALRAGGGVGFIRVRGHDLHAIGRYMDMGADAVVVPHVSTAAEARALAAARTYPPQGTRGYSAPVQRVTRYGADLQAHLTDPGRSALVLGIIESAQGVENIEEIAAVEGMDGFIIGPSDLSAALGCLGEFEHPRYVAAVERIERAVNEQGKLLGTAPYTGTTAADLAKRGHRFLIVGADMSLLREALSALVARYKRDEGKG